MRRFLHRWAQVYKNNDILIHTYLSALNKFEYFEAYVFSFFVISNEHGERITPNDANYGSSSTYHLLGQALFYIYFVSSSDYKKNPLSQVSLSFWLTSFIRYNSFVWFLIRKGILSWKGKFSLPYTAKLSSNRSNICILIVSVSFGSQAL